MAPPIDESIQNYEYNDGAITVANNRFSSMQTRHVAVKQHMVRDTIKGGVVRVEHWRSEVQHADILTEALDVMTFESHARFLLNSQ